ncbi:prepilin-type N-terminal cleavage/methylation domain-containing protein [Bacillus oleivorans]|uniref:Prepilin-type N-terminal cleavage/methylation domain-containing protein n=1 Tax=Bacillus oleivorans TaxID=1448271 RepID=A0A285CVH6_9BACI|nr:prepilin-type N-terminal cleavage/methylation domain-containing protein [Bacillus oleivorans]SNX71534.1 prepilin-type N-terminal cleavage/methylation domain-containing protein [Bacillus oleivorans]
MKNCSKGFTVIELLIAFAVLSIVVVGATGFFTQGFQFTSYNEDKLSAVHLSSLVLEKVQENFMESSCPSPETNLFPSYQHLFDGLDINGAFILNDKRYFITLTVYCDPAESLQTLHVQVYDSETRDQLLSQNFGYVQLQSGGGSS